MARKRKDPQASAVFTVAQALPISSRAELAIELIKSLAPATKPLHVPRPPKVQAGPAGANIA